ncbi:uncharacterized protein LOC120333614 isoform X2 [Styela clava]
MTKICDSNLKEKTQNKEENTEVCITVKLSKSSLDEKKSRRIKRKKAVTTPPNSLTRVGKKKKQTAGQKTNLSASSLSVLQKKLSTNFAGLTPLLNRSRPSDLLIENFKIGDQRPKANKENKSQFTAVVVPIPQPRRFIKTATKKLHLIEKQRKEKQKVAEISSSKTKELEHIERNHSSPNLLLSTLYEKSDIGFDSSILSCSQTLASEFPNVVRFYNNDIAIARNCARKFSSLPLNRWRGQQHCNTLPTHSNQSPFTIRQSRGAARVPYCRNPFTSISSHSVPNTSPTLLNISGKFQKSNKSLSSLRSSSSGWNCLKGLTTSDLANISFDVADNIDVASDSASLPASHADLSKTQDFDSLDLMSSFAKAMNAKNKQHMKAPNQKGSQAQLQYHTGRPRPRIANNFSSSFILPYGLGNRVQSSPVTTPAVPSSSSFHGGPLESLQLMSDNHRSAQRQQSQCNTGQRQQRKYLDRQKMKMLKPLGVNKNQGNITKLYDISTSEFSAAILPDPGTTSYRLTHDVSFDEGSRYRTTDFPHNLGKGKEDSRNPNINGITNQFNSTVLARTNEASNSASQMRHEGRITVNNREHSNNMTNTSNNNNISFKETVPLSLIRMDERFAADLPPASSPSSPAMSPAIAAPTSTSSFIPPPSASRQNPSNTTITTAGGNIMFRLHKEKQNWNYRLGELAISGGGYYSSTVNSNARPDLDSITSLNMTSISSTTQRSLTRERISVAPKSRLSSRYASKNDSNPVPSFSDPCISAPPSFQQRLTDLSILESETIKYERNRKLRRKKNQDKDS